MVFGSSCDVDGNPAFITKRLDAQTVARPGVTLRPAKLYDSLTRRERVFGSKIPACGECRWKKPTRDDKRRDFGYSSTVTIC